MKTVTNSGQTSVTHLPDYYKLLNNIVAFTVTSKINGGTFAESRISTIDIATGQAKVIIGQIVSLYRSSSRISGDFVGPTYALYAYYIHI